MAVILPLALLLCGYLTSVIAVVPPGPGFCLHRTAYPTVQPVTYTVSVRTPEGRVVFEDRVGNKTVIQWRDEYKCCRGFAPNGTDNSTCIPVCPGGCGHGNCTSPYKCTCFEGAHFNPMSRKCVSHCENGCPNGSCKGPNTCVCNEGFVKDSATGKCTPTCNETCANGECTGFNTCTCKAGYSKFFLSSSVCEPSCSSGCAHGKCVSPNVCKCDTGYVNDPTDPTTCIHFCEYGCINGYCTSPGTCTCNVGYTSSLSAHVCVPACTYGCTNGQCIAPDQCECYLGYYKDDHYSCVPQCDPPCVNADCTAPDTCSCHVGYTKYQVNVYMCHASCVGCIHGDCTSPNVCECHEGYIRGEANSSLCVPGRSEEQHSYVGSTTLWLGVVFASLFMLAIVAGGTWYWRRRRITSQCNHFYNPVYMSESMVLALTPSLEETATAQVQMLPCKE